ncbi:MAG: radical SAM protein [Ruminococcaceae bacterium]|nr:radical SAM protein [Oscillospiraceae bacterium]
MKENKFTMERVGIAVSEVCNLNCRLCGAYSPYRKNNYFPPVDELCDYIKRYFSIVDYVDLFSVTGGEPLVYRQLPELMDYLLKYSDQYGKMEIYTNGTTVPSTELLQILKKYGSKFRRFVIDNYGENLSKKIHEISSVLVEFGIPYDIRDYCSSEMHCGGWVDLGKAIEKIHTHEEAAELFQKCAIAQKIRFCFDIANGNLFPCGPLFNRLNLGLPVDDGDYINLMDDTLSIEEQRSKIFNIYNAECLGICQYCKGMCDDSPRYKPAEQLTVDEIKQIRNVDFE